MRHTLPLPSPLSPTKLTTPDPPPTPLHQPPRLRGGARFGCCAIQVWCARCASVERQNIACICCIRRRGRWGGDDYEARGALNTVAAGVKPALHRHLCLFLTFFSRICKNMLAQASGRQCHRHGSRPSPKVSTGGTAGDTFRLLAGDPRRARKSEWGPGARARGSVQ